MDNQFLTPEDFELIMKSSTAPEQQEALKMQMALAEKMRGKMPEMRQAGNVSVAANPLEFLAKGLNDFQGRKSEKDAMAKQQMLIDELRKARATYGRNVMQPGQPQQPMSPAGPQGNGVMTYGVE